jgi:hypothetical protein
MTKLKSFPFLAGSAALAIAGLVAAAPAEAVTFDLTSCHISSSCGPAGTVYGTVTLTQSGSTVDFAVSLSDSNRFVLTGSADDQYFKFNGAPNVGSISVTQNVSGVTLTADAGALNGDGTGNFGFGITCTPISPMTSCAEGGAAALPVGTTLDFAVANSTISQFLVNSGSGNFFVADILCGATSGCTGTGPVDVPVPAPIIGHGLFVLLAIGGVLFGGKLMEDLKKRHLRAA